MSCFGSTLLTRALNRAGVRRLFTLSGNQIMPVFDACLDEGIELVHVRHEAAAVHMADAWSRLTGRPGVALVTAGPGHANALSAMYVALAAESPLVLLSGRSAWAPTGDGAFQEMAQAKMAAHVAKASWTVTDAATLAEDLARAMRLASSARPGPVHLSLPADVLETPLDGEALRLPAHDAFQPSTTALGRRAGEAIVAALTEAARPLVLTGPSLLRGDGPRISRELTRVSQIPVIGMESPRGIDDPSLGAFAEVMAQSDLIVLLGKPLDFALQWGRPPAVQPECRFIHVDADPAAVERTRRSLDDPDKLVLSAVADPLPSAERLVELVAPAGGRLGGWLRDVEAATRYRPPGWARIDSSEGPLHPVEVCRTLHECLDGADEAVFISDGGEFGQWAQACLTAPRRLINGPSGSIGSSIPFALAARLAFPAARIVTVLGDGTFGFHGAELDTAVRYDLPFVAVVGNDACWNAEYQIQRRRYGAERAVGCELLPTRYDEVARALGAHGEHVTSAAALRPALERAFDSERPACVNVMIDRVAAPVIRGWV